MDKKNLGYDLT